MKPKNPYARKPRRLKRFMVTQKKDDSDNLVSLDKYLSNIIEQYFETLRRIELA